ncbi:GTP-binding protein HflX [Rhizomicrobium palustre]|uniref:GTPase HflX n=2 Tax=Rhizomicrobium palustre TaxID=189966 RepID=A0A846N440_9PROT|nr:GTPase HflX [Rhizomicrobium palustre]NIK89972.1 GTP-binding protein HflX [Rhizomicrobium palustre]
MSAERDTDTVRPRMAVVVHVEPKSRLDGLDRDAAARLAEAVGLTAAIGLVVVGEYIVPLSRPTPATLIGSGKVEEIGADIHARQEADEDAPEVVIVNAALSPVQQRNLEQAWKAKVLDRTALILEIFGERARTREGRLQVELAHLSYQRSRLVRTWTHLERQRGGFGFLGGPGETQIETDRRLIGERLAKIRREIEGVKRTRHLQRRARKRVPFPVIALVGYTNAGKSTLFNKLTDAGVLAKDVLFATLDPTMRGLKLPGGTRVILSDTVGFIADLPHELVAAFRATLEEVLEADLIVHVRDCAHEETEAQKVDVLKVLSELGIEPGITGPGAAAAAAGDDRIRPFVEVLNKIDLLEPEIRDGLIERNERPDGQVAVSAITGEGLEQLLARFEAEISGANIYFSLSLDAGDGEGLAWVYRHGQVIEKTYNDDATVDLALSATPTELEKFEHRFGEKMARERTVAAES